MILFKELEILGWEILQKDVIEFLSKNIDIYNRSKNISLIPIPIDYFFKLKLIVDKLFSIYNIKCIKIFLYVMNKNEDGSLHNDNSKFDYRINLPILNCKKTYTEFYSVNKFRYYQNTHYTIKLPEENAEINLIDKLELKKPTLVNVNEFHRIVMNEKNAPRISMSILFDKKLNFLID
jgi:hypothetical protein